MTAPAPAPAPTELLPCPFCGGEAERYDDHDTGSFNFGMSCITCKRCGASSPMHGDRKENLVDSWNTRQAASVERAEVAGEAVAWRHPNYDYLTDDPAKTIEQMARESDAEIARITGLLVDQINENKSLRAAQASKVPEGYALVPLVPTPAMIEAGCENNPTQWNDRTDPGFTSDVANDVYVAMVRASELPSADRGSK